MSPNLMNPAFHYRAEELACEDTPLTAIAERFGTPAYVYSQASLLGNFARIKEGLRRVPGLICYSVKANSNLKILNLLRDADAGFDVVSGGELARLRRIHADPARVVFSGVGKTEAEIDAGLEAGILMFNVESAGELDLIEARARHLRKRADISIRINPDVEAETHPYVATGQFIHKFGLPKEEALALYSSRVAGTKHLNVRGVACHIGSQILEVSPFVEALEEILGVAEVLRAKGVMAEFLDLGGGFGIRYANEQPLDVGRLTEELTKRMKGKPYQLIVEPGRAVVAEAGALLTRALYVKKNERKIFVIVDAGMNDLMRPALYGSYHEIVPVLERPGEEMVVDVVGPLCETGDFLAQDRSMAEVRPGDLLAVKNAGAYGYVLSSNYNSRPRPAEVLVHGETAELVRPRECVEDLMDGEAF